MNKLCQALKRGSDALIQGLLVGFIRVAYRPKAEYASEKAREAAFAEPRVLVCNHIRGWDGAVVYACLPRQRVRALVAKDMMEEHLGVRLITRCLPVLPIDRREVSLSWLRGSRRSLKQGEHIMIFPEGKCRFDMGTGEMKPGCILLAATAGAELLPIYHNGCYRPFFGRRFRMIIGEPISVTPPPEGTSPEELERQAAELLTVMQGLERQLTGTVRGLDKEE